MEGVESLYNKIGGPRNWQPRWVINVLNEMQSSITSVDEGFDGNWVIAFYQAWAEGEKADAFLHGNP